MEKKGKTLREILREELGFEPAATTIIQKAIFEHDWKNDIFTSVDLADLTGFDRSITCGGLSDLSRRGYLECLGITSQRTKVWKVVKKPLPGDLKHH